MGMYECVALNSHLQLFSQTVPVFPGHLLGPQRICPVHLLSASASSGGPAAHLPAATEQVKLLLLCIVSYVHH